MKKKICMILGIIMIMIMIVPVNAAGSTATFTAYKDDEEVSSVNVGDEFSVVLAIEGYSEPTDGVYSYISVAFATPTYDETCFEWTGSEILISNRMLGMVNHNSNIVDGEEQGKQGVVAVAKGVNINTDLVKFTFKALNVTDGSESISFNVYTQDKESKEIDTIPCSITVLGKDFETTPTLTGTDEVTYDGEFHTISVDNLPDGATVAWSCKTSEDGTYVDVESPSFKNAGTYYVKAAVSKAGYNTVTLEGELTINKADVTVQVADITRDYDSTDTVATTDATITASGIVAGDELSFQLDEITLPSANVGTYTVNDVDIAWTGTDEVKANYNLPSTAQVKVEITRKTVTVTPNNQSKLVGADDPTLTYVAKDLMGTDNLVGELARESGNTAGTYKILQGTLTDENNPNYHIEFVEGRILTITDKVYTRIEIEKNPNKTEYKQDQTLDIDGMVLKAYYNDPATGEEKWDVIEDTDANIKYTPDKFETIGDSIEVTISYFEKTTKLTVKVTEKKLIGLKVVPNDTDYIEDEDFVADITVYPVYDNGIDDYSPLKKSEYTVNAPETLNQIGEVEITVTYNDDVSIKGTYKINVRQKKLTDLTVIRKPKTDYISGQYFDPTGAEFEATYDNGKTYPVTWSDGNLNPKHDKSEPLTMSDKFVIFTYTDNGISKTVTIELTITPKAVESIEVTAYSGRYIEGQSFDKSKVKLTLTYNDGSTEENVMPGDALKVSKEPLDSGTYDITLTYAECTVDVRVSVDKKHLKSIEVSTSKTSYVDGETLDLTKITVNAYYDNFPDTAVPVYEFTANVDKVSLENATNGKIDVTVTFEGLGGKLTITVDPCKATITTTVGGITSVSYFASVNDALKAANEGDTIVVEEDDEITESFVVDSNITIQIKEDANLTQKEGADITVSEGSLTIKNESANDVEITINGEDVTVGPDEETTVEPVVEEDNFDAYYAFYLQMLQWRNRTFIVSYKQTEGGTISGANTARFSQSVTFTVTPDDGYAIADVIVNGKSVGAVDSFTIKNIKSNTTVSATFEKIETETVEVEIVPETTPWANPFTDVGEMDAFYTAVQYVYENGLFKGMSNTEFGPAITMNRAMFVTVLGRLTGVNVDDFTTVTFADCEAGSWYAPYVEWAAQAGIVKGMSATEFAPDAEITVEQALTILYRYMTTMGYDLTGADTLTAYADAASVSDWAMEAVQWAVANEIYEVADTLAPQSAAARSLVATMLYNLSGMLAK